MKNRPNYFDLVLGGSSEIGSAIIKILIGNHRNVIFTYNKNSDNEKLLELGNKKGVKVICIKSNIQDTEDLNKIHSLIIEKNIALNSLTYNIGKINDSLFAMMSEDNFRDILEVNLVGCFRICKLLLQNLAVNKGSIVFISSISGLIGKIGQANYSCSKAALIALGRNLAAEYAKLGVRVNTIAPGFIQTKMLGSFSEEQIKQISKEIPLKRLGSPIDIAHLVNFLISEHSSYITGQTIVIDGGLIMK